MRPGLALSVADQVGVGDFFERCVATRTTGRSNAAAVSRGAFGSPAGVGMAQWRDESLTSMCHEYCTGDGKDGHETLNIESNRGRREDKMR